MRHLAAAFLLFACGAAVAAAAIEILAENGVEAFEIGSIVERQAGQPQTVIV